MVIVDVTKPQNNYIMYLTFHQYNYCKFMCKQSGLWSSTVDQVLKYTKYPKYISSTSTGQVLIFFKST